MQFSQLNNAITLQGPVGKLDAVITRPPEQKSSIIAVICHPHPLYGGTMNNKVVTTIARALQDLGIWTVRFNFRGVEKSEGEYGNGVGESEDLVAILEWVKKEFSNYQIWLAGFSFGAGVAISVAAKWPIKQLITVAPPVGRVEFLHLPEPTMPWLLVQGGADEVIAAEKVLAWVKTLPHQPQLIYFPDAGHFFHGQLVELRNELVKMLKLNSDKLDFD